MKRLKRILYGTLALLTVITVTLLLVLAVWRQQMLPQTRGTLMVKQLAGELRIERDAAGIPTIHADSVGAGLYGLGFAHAQDRLWQLELHRRIGAGELAEAFGAAALENDRFLRALGIHQAAQAQWQRLDEPSRQAVQAYVDGINAFIGEHLRARPPEFVLLGLRPKAWQPVDVLAWSLMMAWDLGGNWQTELLRLRLAQRLPLQRIRELLPPYPGEQPLASADYTQMVRGLGLVDPVLEQVIAASPESGVEGAGSNNWVVSGQHTRSGKPLLANDPHLRLSSPALWYVARLRVPGLEIAGVTIPGLPLVVLGQNRHIAWGFTNTNPDVQDLYLERVHPHDSGRYQTPDGWAGFESREEVIHVRGGADQVITVRRSRHGPVISDAATTATAGIGGGTAQSPDYVLALRWAALDPESDSIATGLRFNRARSVAEFMHLARGYGAPMQNMVVADADGEHGHIGFIAAGRVPLRRPDNDLHGLVPAPGWLERYDWVGWIDPAQLPQQVDPPRGWIATANQRIHAAGYPHYLTSEWQPPYRQQRIEQLLAARPQHDPDSMAAIQRDVLSLAAQPLLPVLRAAAASAVSSPTLQALKPQINAFDGLMAPDAAMPLVFHAWVRLLTQRVFADELGDLWPRQFSDKRSFRDALEGVLARHDAWWCDDKRTPDRQESCDELARAALEQALRELSAQLGPDPARWHWAELHQARSEHRPFSRVAALAPFFEVRVGVGGDGHTVNVSRVGLQPDRITGELFLSEHAASMRAIYDLADPAGSRVIQPTGQSGLPLNRWQAGFAADWAAGRHVPLWAAEQGAEVLVLRGR